MSQILMPQGSAEDLFGHFEGGHVKQEFNAGSPQNGECTPRSILQRGALWADPKSAHPSVGSASQDVVICCAQIKYVAREFRERQVREGVEIRFGKTEVSDADMRALSELQREFNIYPSEQDEPAFLTCEFHVGCDGSQLWYDRGPYYLFFNVSKCFLTAEAFNEFDSVTEAYATLSNYSLARTLYPDEESYKNSRPFSQPGLVNACDKVDPRPCGTILEKLHYILFDRPKPTPTGHLRFEHGSATIGHHLDNGCHSRGHHVRYHLNPGQMQ